ncbi:MAG: molybdenum ABC transporter ATP-binding protein [Pseudomonadota bacterium]
MSLSVNVQHRIGSLNIDVAFDAPGGLTALFGRSGAGKTTLINAVAGIVRPDKGRITAGGEALFDSAAGVNLPPWRRKLGYVFQDARLFPHMSVQGNIRYGQKRRDRTQEAQIVDLLGIGPLLKRRPGALSGGEKQRVAIARALLAKPAIVLADEPLASLDAERKAEVMPYFDALRDGLAVPILYVSHSADEVARLANRVVALQDGRVLRQGSALEVLGDPAITPLGVREAGALIEAQIEGHETDGLTRLSAGSAALLVPRLDLPIGAPVRVRVQASDVMLALSRPEGISALNVLPAVIQSLRDEGANGVLVQLSVGSNTFLARVTQRSARALALRNGLEIFAVIKAISVSPR